MIANNIAIGEDGHLYFAGQDTVDLAEKYGTPLYLMDEDKIRENCRKYIEAFRKHFGENAYPLYAGKANSFVGRYSIVMEEGMGIDVVSSGELFTAAKGGFDLSKAYFHGNNKTDEDISYGMEMGIGYFIVDNEDELDEVDLEAGRRGILQKILLRITPGIDPHTYEAISTGKVDSKFGNAIETGQAEDIAIKALAKKNVELMGFHCHVGSQVFEEDVFERTAEIMLDFVSLMEKEHGFKTKELNLGGGYGVRYTEKDPLIHVEGKLESVAKTIDEACERLGIERPDIRMEPGRSIVADAGMTLYKVGGVKRIPGYRNYVSVDGGMPDNPRYALYKANYTCISANKAGEIAEMECSLVGRCCESGDIIQEDIKMPESIGRGDYIAVCTTGAYNYSMASNYNRIPRPPIVMLKGVNESYVAVKRESFEDLVRNEL